MPLPKHPRRDGPAPLAGIALPWVALCWGSGLHLLAGPDPAANLWLNLASACLAALLARMRRRGRGGPGGWVAEGVLWHVAAVQVANLLTLAAGAPLARG